jgi:hypothetical protein
MKTRSEMAQGSMHGPHLMARPGYPAEVECARRPPHSRQCHQNTATMARTAAAITTKTNAEF